MKKTIVALLSITVGLLNSVALADTAACKEVAVQTTANASRYWVFELKNKTKEPIYVQLMQVQSNALGTQGKLVPLIPVPENFKASNNKELPRLLNQPNPNTRVQASKGKNEADAGYLRLANFDPSQATTLFIWDQNAVKNPGLTVNIQEKPTYSFFIKQNKNRKAMYLTWEGNKLRVQKGSGDETQSGLPLLGNIADNEIAKK